MNPLNTIQFLNELGRNSLQASVLIAAVLLVQLTLGRHLQPRWRCALWLLVVARLLIPLSFSSVASLSNIWPLSWQLISNLNSSAYFNLIHPGASGVIPSLPTSSGSPGELLSHINISLPVGIFPQVSWAGVIFGIWVTGVVVLLAHIAISSLRMARQCKRMKPLNDPAVLAVLEESYLQMKMPRQLGTPRFLRILESIEVSSPFVHGLFRPCLILPKDFTAKFSPEEWRFVFLHEIAHLKRHDLWMNWIMALLQAVHWFNPFVWMAFARWRTEREIVCDAMVLEAVGRDERRQYGHTILKLLESFTPSLRTPALVGILENNHQLGQRIGMIRNYAPKARWSLLAALLITALGVVGLTDATVVVPTPAAGILILSATYGSGTHVADVTDRVNDLLRNPDVEFFANPGWLQTDPIPWWNKELVIVYEYKGKRHMFTTGEGGRVTVSELATAD